MSRADDEIAERMTDLIVAWNDYPAGVRGEMMLKWPDLFGATSRLVRYVEAVRRHA